MNRNYPVFLLGDFNMKHPALGHQTQNKWGTGFVDKCLKRPANIHFIGPSFNTFYKGAKRSKPDLIFGNKATNELHQLIKQGPLAGSDHTAVILQISSQPICTEIPVSYNYGKAKWKEYRQILNTYVTPDLQGSSHETLVSEITKITDRAITAGKDCIPITKHRTYANVPPKSTNTIQLEQCVNNLNNRLASQYLPPSMAQNALKKNLLEKHRNSRNKDYADHQQKELDELSSAHKTPDFWKKFNKIKGNITNPPETTLVMDGRSIKDPQEVVDGFGTAWSAVFKDNPDPISPEAIEIAKEYEEWNADENNIPLTMPHEYVDTNRLTVPTKEQLRENFSRHQLLAPIELDDVKTHIKRLKDKKAPGESGLSNRMVKKFPDKFLMNWVKIYNAALSLGYFPENFKKAITVMIRKKQKCGKDPLNYRPISLLEVMGKIYEHVINHRLKMYLEEHHLINDLQFGFRQGRSCHTSIHTMLEFITQAQKGGLSVYFLSKDVEKAFDKVHHPALIYKIFTKFQLPELLCKTLVNFLQDRQIKIKHNGKFSRPFTPESGVPQGSVIGPMLYIMSINDAPKPSTSNEYNNNLRRNTDGNSQVDYYSEELNIYFADDNVIMVAGYREIGAQIPGTKDDTQFGTRKFRDLIQKSTYWEEGNRIKTNAIKSKCMVFSKTEPRTTERWLSLYPDRNYPNDEKIKYTNNHVILGITFDSKLTFQTHIKKLKDTLTGDVRSLRKIDKCNIEIKSFLYKVLLNPKITYAYVIY